MPNLKSPQSVDTVGSAQDNKQGEFLDYEKPLEGEDLDIAELTKLVAQARILEKKATLKKELNSIYSRLYEGEKNPKVR